MQSHIKETKAFQVDAKGNASLSSVFGLLKAGLDFGGQRRRELLVEGEIDPVQKLQKILTHFETKHLLGDLNESLATGEVEPGVTCFAYQGAFSCLDREEMATFLGINDNYVQKQEEETSYSPVHGISGLRTTGRMCVMKSECCGHVIFLACSMKYFSDMGGSRVTVGDKYSDQDLVD